MVVKFCRFRFSINLRPKLLLYTITRQDPSSDLKRRTRDSCFIVVKRSSDLVTGITGVKQGFMFNSRTFLHFETLTSLNTDIYILIHYVKIVKT